MNAIGGRLRPETTACHGVGGAGRVSMRKLQKFDVKLKLPLAEVRGTWVPDDAERMAAWELYVELVTRSAVVELAPTEGLLREALSSLYALFDLTRAILKRYGPSVAKPKGN